MMRFINGFVLILFIVSIPVAAQSTCEGGLAPRLTVEGYGRVTEGDANNVRDEPSRNGELIGQIEGGGLFTVLDSFTCTGNFTWWQVEYFDGSDMVTGWTAESNGTDYFLEPITDENFVLFRNLSFTLPASLAGEVATRTQDFTETISIEITFPDYEELFEVGADAEIRIFSAEAGDDGDDFQDQWEGGFGYAYNGLINILETRPDLLTFSAGRNDLPDLSPGVAALTLAQRQYLDFQNGSGYRFLSAYAQMDVSVNNGNLRYRYQGLTADENYLVDVTFAVDAPSNPPRFVPLRSSNMAAEFEHSYEYGEAVAAFYDAIPPEAFTPSLLDLDALIASIEVR